MKLKTKPNNNFKNTLLHNTEIPLHRIYSKTEENNTKVQISILHLSSFNDNDYDETAYIMNKSDFFNNFNDIILGRFTKKGLYFNDKYIKGYISYISNNKNARKTSDNLTLYMNKENVSIIKIPAYLTKKYIHDNKLSFNKNIRYKLLNKDSLNLIITDHRFHCMFLDFIPEEYKDYYIVFDDSFKNNILHLRTKCEYKKEIVDYHSNLEVQNLPIGELIKTEKSYDTFKEATFDLITNEIKNTKTIKILTHQINTRVRQGKYSKGTENEYIDSTNDPKIKAYFDTPHISNYFE